MAPRPYWKGYLKLSLVACPVSVFTATTSSERVSFRQINRKTGNRLRQQLVDDETREPVDAADKVRGYEVDKGVYVQVEDEEIEALEIESNHTIDIDSFVPREEIDQRYLNHPYYIAPDGKAALDAFAVIRDAMKDQDRVALARIVLLDHKAPLFRRRHLDFAGGLRGLLEIALLPVGGQALVHERSLRAAWAAISGTKTAGYRSSS